MKKVVIHLSDSTYEKLRFESIKEKKSIPDVIGDRIFYKPFDDDTEEAFSIWMNEEIDKIIKE